MEVIAAAAGKGALTAAVKPTVDFFRVQFARRGAEFADISSLNGADPELDEALSVLQGGATLPAAIVGKLKGFLSQRPDCFASEEARHFISDDRVIALVKSGARKTVVNQGIDEERAGARAIYAELFGPAEEAWGERLLEDAVAFCTMTVLAHLTPGDRVVAELLAAQHEELVGLIRGVSDQITGLAGWGAEPEVDRAVLDTAVEAETKKLRRQRFVHDDLDQRAGKLAERLEHGLRLATPATKGEAYREIAIVLSRAKRTDDAAAALQKARENGVTDLAPEEARLFLNQESPDEAMRLLRERSDAPSRSLLIDAIRRKNGESEALRFFEESLSGDQLTGHALQAMAIRMVEAERWDDSEALLRNASAYQIDENPLLLFIRARLLLARSVAPDIAHRTFVNGGMIPRPGDLSTNSEGRARLDAALRDLRHLASFMPDLDAPDLASLVEMNIIFLEASAADSAQRQKAHAKLEQRLSDPNEAIQLAPLAAMFGIPVDWEALEAQLQQAERLGGWDDAQLRAAFSFVMKRGNAREIATFTGTHRRRLEGSMVYGSVVGIEIEALAKAGDLAAAKALLDEERLTLGEEQHQFLANVLAELEGADPIALRLARFEATDSTHDLEILVEGLSEARDERLGDYLIQLWHRRHQIQDAQRACDALVTAGKEAKLDEFLQQLGSEAEHDPYLRVHLAFSLQRQGKSTAAEYQLAALKAAGHEDANTRHLEVMLAVETGRWQGLETFAQRELGAASDRTAAELLNAARIANAIDSASTMALVREAVSKAGESAQILLDAYSLAVNRGEERSTEVNGWIARAIELSGSDGPVQSRDFEEVVAIVREGAETSDRLNNLIMSAEVPLFLAMRPLNGTQSALVYGRMHENADELDSRRRVVLPFFAGNRAQYAGDVPTAVSFEPLALLILDHLGLLDRALTAFDDVVLPAGTLHSFFEELARTRHVQPSRIEQARRLLASVSSGTLSVESLPSDHEMVSRVGEEFSALYGAALARDGFVVDTAPLHVPGSSLRETADATPFQDRLLSPEGLVQRLKEAGILSAARADEAGKAIAGAGGSWGSEPPLRPSRPLFLSTIASNYLSDAGVLPELKQFFGAVFVLPEVSQLAEGEVKAGENAARIRNGIERVRSILSAAISDGRARIGPSKFHRETKERLGERAGRDLSPVLSAMMDAAGTQAFFCDDRAMNKYPHFSDRDGHSVPILTTIDLIAILHKKGILSDLEIASARERLRNGGAAFVPLEFTEIARITVESNWEIGPNAELRAVRDSIHLSLARNMLQLPDERPWLRAVTLSIAYGIREAWRGIASPAHAARAATYLFEMIPNAATWSADDQSGDRAAWIQDTSRHALWAIATIFDLPPERVESYRLWFAERVAPIVNRRDPGAFEAVATTLFGFFSTPMEEGEE